MGIYPASGVTHDQASNAVDVTAQNCETQLFYPSGGRCSPRLDGAAMNAMISELLNAVRGFGIDYDCSRVDNLYLALQNVIVDDEAAIATVSEAEEAGSDSFGNPVAEGDPVIRFGNGDTLVVLQPIADTYSTAAAAEEDGTDHFGVAYVTGDVLVTMANGDVFAVPQPAESDGAATVAAAGEDGTDDFGNDYQTGDPVITFADDTTLAVDPTEPEVSCITRLRSGSTALELTDTHLDGHHIIFMDYGGAKTVNLGSALTAEQPLAVINSGGGGTLTVTTTTGTLNSANSGVSVATQHAGITIIPEGSDTYTLMGVDAP